MAYTDELKQLIKRVEANRPHRLGKKREGREFTKMSLAEMENRLKTLRLYYKEGSLKELKVGSSLNPGEKNTIFPMPIPKI